VSIEPLLLFRHLDEQAFRFNNRKGTDAMHFALALEGILGQRLTYTALTGSELPPSMLNTASRNKGADDAQTCTPTNPTPPCSNSPKDCAASSQLGNFLRSRQQNVRAASAVP
jgi:hypothetical protein